MCLFLSGVLNFLLYSHILEIIMVSQHPGKFRILQSNFPDAGTLVKVKKDQNKRRISLWYSYHIAGRVGKRDRSTYFMEATFQTQ